MEGKKGREGKRKGWEGMGREGKGRKGKRRKEKKVKKGEEIERHDPIIISPCSSTKALIFLEELFVARLGKLPADPFGFKDDFDVAVRKINFVGGVQSQLIGKELLDLLVQLVYSISVWLFFSSVDGHLPDVQSSSDEGSKVGFLFFGWFVSLWVREDKC